MGYDGHLFFENGQNLMWIWKMQATIKEKCFLFEIIVSELVALSCL